MEHCRRSIEGVEVVKRTTRFTTDEEEGDGVKGPRWRAGRSDGARAGGAGDTVCLSNMRVEDDAADAMAAELKKADGEWEGSKRRRSPSAKP